MGTTSQPQKPKDFSAHTITHFKCACGRWNPITANEFEPLSASSPCECGVSSSVDLAAASEERFHYSPNEPKIDPCWPWALITKTVMNDGRIVEWKAQGYGSGAVSKIRVRYASGLQHYQFRRGKPISIQLEDAQTIFTLKRKGEHEDNNNQR